MIKFQIYMGRDQLYHWRLLASNGEIVCWSEGYSSLQNADKSVEWVKKNAVSAPTYTI